MDGTACPALEIKAVSKSFGSVNAVRNVSFSVPRGEFFGLLGPNGAGKTTLINSVAGLCRVDSGSIKVMGHDVLGDYQSARHALGVVPQELVFDPFFTVRQTLTFQSGYFGVKKNDVWIDEILFGLNLTEKANANMRSLSGGMKRRVLVAQALVHRPPVIILDEPTAGVDVDLRKNLWLFIQKLNDEGHTIVLTTHYLEEAESLCSRIGMLKNGELVMIESTDRLLQRDKECVIRFRVKQPAKAGLSPLETLLPDTVCVESGEYLVRVSNPSEIEGVLRSVRELEYHIDTLETENEDLEDVFLSIMRASPERSE
ncbi:MAG: ABC transporter ATP-binding protein [Proteobacteria bacterium]|nr:ABC transporter ATP-binding protein [Pseudomonadota bacterium]